VISYVTCSTSLQEDNVADDMNPRHLSRRQFLGGAAAVAAGGTLGLESVYGQQRQTAATDGVVDIVLVNGKIHTMDANNRIVSQVFIRDGRFAAVSNNVGAQGNVRRIDLKGRTVIPGLIDAHNHIVLVGNRPGWHTPLEHVFTIPDAIAELKTRSAQVPRGEFITTVGPVSRLHRAAREPTVRAKCGSRAKASWSEPMARSRGLHLHSRYRPCAKNC
jgi:imidazolonepropionase-like amidohydrolase